MNYSFFAYVGDCAKTSHSLDVRRGRSGRHWWNEERFGRRVRFLLPQTSSSPPSSGGGSFSRNASALARLQIANVTRQDGGDYRCRVDFNSAPSRNFKYRLIVIGEPQISYFFIIVIFDIIRMPVGFCCFRPHCFPSFSSKKSSLISDTMTCTQSSSREAALGGARLRLYRDKDLSGCNDSFSKREKVNIHSYILSSAIHWQRCLFVEKFDEKKKNFLPHNRRSYDELNRLA